MTVGKTIHALHWEISTVKMMSSNINDTQNTFQNTNNILKFIRTHKRTFIAKTVQRKKETGIMLTTFIY